MTRFFLAFTTRSNTKYYVTRQLDSGPRLGNNIFINIITSPKLFLHPLDKKIKEKEVEVEEEEKKPLSYYLQELFSSAVYSPILFIHFLLPFLLYFIIFLSSSLLIFILIMIREWKIFLHQKDVWRFLSFFFFSVFFYKILIADF